MASFNTTISAMFVITLAMSLSNITAYHTSLPAGETPTSSFHADVEAATGHSTSDVPNNEASSSIIHVPSFTAHAPYFLVSFLDEISAANSPDFVPSGEAVEPTITITFPDGKASFPATVVAPAPLNYVPIIDTTDGFDVPIDEEQKDNQFVEKYLQIAVSNTNAFLTEFLQKLKSSGQADECTEICEQMLLSANDVLNHGLISIGSKEYFQADIEVHAFSSNVKTCMQCYGDAADPELLKFINWANGISDACLGKIGKYEK